MKKLCKRLGIREVDKLDMIILLAIVLHGMAIFKAIVRMGEIQDAVVALIHILR